MRILFLTHRLPYAPNRGDRIRAYHLLREMSRFASVSLFSLVHDEDEASRAGQVPFAREVITARATRVRNLVRGAARFASSRPLTHSLLDAPDARTALARLVNAAPPDVVVAFCSGMARFALEPPLDDFPLVLDMVDVDSVKWGELAGDTRGPRRMVYAREAATLGAFEAAAARRAKMTLVVNERERDALLALAPDAPVQVLSNGVSLSDFAPAGPPSESAVVLFCGVLNYRPNEEGVRWFAEKVWPHVRAARNDARFAIVGFAPTRAIRAMGERDRSVEVVGSVPLVQPYMWEAALSVAPLHVARGVQTKVLESLAAGVPVVVTPPVWEGLPVEALPGCIAADDPGAFAEAVVRLLNGSAGELRALAGRADLSSLDWGERLRPLEAILHGAVREAGLAPAR